MASRYERFWQQLAEVERQHQKKLAVWPPTAKPHNDIEPQYVYEPNQVLCRTSDIDRVIPGLKSAYKRKYEFNEHLTVIQLRPGSNVQGECDNARRIDKARNKGVEKPDLATPIHWISITPVDLCPADEPVRPGTDSPAAPWPSQYPDLNAGKNVTVTVIDTGVYADFREDHPWLSGVEKPETWDFKRPFQPAPKLVDGRWIWRGPIPAALEDIYSHDTHDEQRVIREYAGHGVFCAGVVAAAAPGAKIRIAKLLDYAGALPETEFCDELLMVLERLEWPNIISLSAGVGTMNGQPLVGLERLMKKLAEHPETLLVAAAGNDAKRDDIDKDGYHFQPASHSHDSGGSIISVGALRENLDGLACFTNYGSSVSVYACGENHINAYLRGRYIYRHDGAGECCRNYYPEPLYDGCTCTTGKRLGYNQEFEGIARWSGTSFATPLVAGMIARQLSTNLTRGSRRVAADMIAEAKRIPAGYEGGAQIPVFR